MSALSDTELRIIAEVVTELASFRGTDFEARAQALAFARAAATDSEFKARLAEIRRRLV